MPQGLIHQLLLFQHGVTGREYEKTVFSESVLKRAVALGVPELGL